MLPLIVCWFLYIIFYVVFALSGLIFDELPRFKYVLIFLALIILPTAPMYQYYVSTYVPVSEYQVYNYNHTEKASVDNPNNTYHTYFVVLKHIETDVLVSIEVDPSEYEMYKEGTTIKTKIPYDSYVRHIEPVLNY